MQKQNKQRFFRAVPLSAQTCKAGILEPRSTDVEKTVGDTVCTWYPLVNTAPIFSRATEKVLCFAKTPAGAVIGSVTGESEFSGGPRCILETFDTPDQDLSENFCGDFHITEEVRFHKPVTVRKFAEFTVNSELLRDINRAYHEECAETDDFCIDETGLLQLRKEINRKLGYKDNVKIETSDDVLRQYGWTDADIRRQFGKLETELRAQKGG